MNYTLNQLQIFLKVAQTASVTKAAEALNLTQPAVSIQLKNFQDQFDIPLTEIVGRKIYVTDFGKEVAAAAEQIIEQVYEINYKTEAFKGQLFGKLKIAVVSTGKYVMPFFISDFMNQHPQIELQMDVSNKNKVLQNLENNEIDFALVSILPTNMNIEKIDLIINKLYLVGQYANPITDDNKKRIAIENLPLIYREPGSGTRQVMEQFIEKKKINVKKKIELTSNEAVKQAIMAGLGYSIMPLIGIKNEIKDKQLSIIPFKGLPISTTWSLVWLKGKKHSPAAKAYLDYLKISKTTIAKKYFDWHLKYL